MKKLFYVLLAITLSIPVILLVNTQSANAQVNNIQPDTIQVTIDMSPNNGSYWEGRYADYDESGAHSHFMIKIIKIDGQPLINPIFIKSRCYESAYPAPAHGQGGEWTISLIRNGNNYMGSVQDTCWGAVNKNYAASCSQKAWSTLTTSHWQNSYIYINDEQFLTISYNQDCVYKKSVLTYCNQNNPYKELVQDFSGYTAEYIL